MKYPEINDMRNYPFSKLSESQKCGTRPESRGQIQITNATQEINCQEVSCDI